MTAYSAVASHANQIVVGQPLPFSIFAGSKKLLLAKGHMVESESMRDSLLSQGKYCDGAAANRPTLVPLTEVTDEREPAVDPLAELRREYSNTASRARRVLQMSPDEASPGHSVWLIGTHEHSFVLTAPLQADGSLLPIAENQGWVFRSFVGTAAVRFQAPIVKVLHEPFPHLYIGTPERVESRRVRGAPRAWVCLDAVLGAGGGIQSVVIDLSTGGARVAVRQSVELAVGERVRFQSMIPLLNKNFSFCNECVITAKYGVVDSRFPTLICYGLRFGKSTDLEELLLHGFVHQSLSSAFDTLSESLVEASDLPPAPAG